MRTTKSGDISRYGVVALVLTLVVMAALHAYRGTGAAYEPLAADRVTAELARTVSYGLIDTDAAHTASAVHRGAAPTPAAQAS